MRNKYVGLKKKNVASSEKKLCLCTKLEFVINVSIVVSQNSKQPQHCLGILEHCHNLINRYQF